MGKGKMKWILAAVFCLPLLAAGQAALEPQPPASELQSLIERYAKDCEAMDWFWDIPASALCSQKKQAFCSEWQERLARVNFDPLSPAGRVDYLLLRNRLRCEQHNLDVAASRLAEVVELLPALRPIVSLAENRLLKKKLIPHEAAGQLAELARLASLACGRFTTVGAVKPSLLSRAVELTRRLRRSLQEWSEFYQGYDPLFTWWAGDPYGKADQSLDKLIKAMEQALNSAGGDSEGSPIVGDPIGRDGLLEELAQAMIPYTPEELIEIGRKELAWCENEIVKASREMGCGDDWRQALEKVKNDFAEPGSQVELVRALGEEAIAYVEQHDLISIPDLARATWKIDMISPERQRFNPFLTGGSEVSVSAPTAAMSHEEKLMSLRGNNRHFTRAVVHHELIPGHFLQQFIASRYRAYRQIFDTPFWSEGWPLHWEMLLWDRGFAKTPEDRIGMLFWRMHRCARIVFSLGFHLGKMSAKECVDMLVRRVGHEPANAAAEVRRSFADHYPPLYQCAYLLGGLQIRALYREMVDGGKMTPRAFHDAVIRENSIPIELLRLYLTGRPIEKNRQASWRFYQ